VRFFTLNKEKKNTLGLEFVSLAAEGMAVLSNVTVSGK
jgi:hypothetical protein